MVLQSWERIVLKRSLILPMSDPRVYCSSSALPTKEICVSAISSAIVSMTNTVLAYSKMNGVHSQEVSPSRFVVKDLQLTYPARAYRQYPCVRRPFQQVQTGQSR